MNQSQPEQQKKISPFRALLIFNILIVIPLLFAFHHQYYNFDVCSALTGDPNKHCSFLEIVLNASMLFQVIYISKYDDAYLKTYPKATYYYINFGMFIAFLLTVHYFIDTCYTIWETELCFSARYMAFLLPITFFLSLIFMPTSVDQPEPETKTGKEEKQD